MLKKILACLLIMSALDSEAQDQQEIQKLEQVINCISTIYQDTINQHRLVEQTIKTMFERLDPHTVYRTKEEADEDRRKQAASFIGIGIQFRMFDDSMTIVRVRPESPADKAGLKAGNKISSIDGTEVTGHLLAVNDVRNLILSNKSDSISLGVFRAHMKAKELKICKAELTNNSIESFYAPNDSCIYLKISRFSQSTADEFKEIISSFGKKNRRNIILDLRDNAGGMLATCLEICDNFFAPNMMMLSARGIHMEDRSYFSTDNKMLEESRICVIINDKSASASEVISGAIQDWDRGVIIGRRSFGKGLVQQIFNLNDGSQIRITNAKYYTPSGRCIQKPYKPGNFSEYFNETQNRKTYGENIDPSKIIYCDTTVYKTIIHHRRVYSQSGITPDIFIAEDTTKIPDFWSSWTSYGFVDNFVLNYMNRHEMFKYRSYSNFKKFETEFQVDSGIMDELHSYCCSDTSKCERISLEKYQKTLKTDIGNKLEDQVKSRFAYYIFGRNESRMILNAKDTEVNKALELINKPEEYYKALN